MVESGEHFLPQDKAELDRTLGLAKIIEEYFPEDKDFTTGMDEQDLIGALYGMLLGIGEDPDEILAKNGITEYEV